MPQGTAYLKPHFSQGGWCIFPLSQPRACEEPMWLCLCYSSLPKFTLLTVMCKEMPKQLFEELAGLALPASPPAWEQGKLLPCNLLILAALLCLRCDSFPLPRTDSKHGLCLSVAVLKPQEAETSALEILSSLAHVVLALWLYPRIWRVSLCKHQN